MRTGRNSVRVQRIPRPLPVVFFLVVSVCGCEDSSGPKGQVIAYIAEDDEDGGAWAPHLHFGVRRGAYSIDEEICGAWLYVGYTRECLGVSHEEHRDYWLDPGDFIAGRVSLTGTTS